MTAFWDSSALTAVFVRETTTPQARKQLQKTPSVVWWGTPVEIQSAMMRLARSGDLSETDRVVVMDQLKIAQAGWQEILPSDKLREVAGDMLRMYSLRAADSLQLAAAMIWCCMHPASRKFVCQDQRLGDAARQAGFSLIQF